MEKSNQVKKMEMISDSYFSKLIDDYGKIEDPRLLRNLFKIRITRDRICHKLHAEPRWLLLHIGSS